MNRDIVCVISEEECNKLFEVYGMKNALEDLALVIAKDNEILKDDSDLYNRLVYDYKNYKHELKNFWEPYLDKYRDRIGVDSQLTVDYATHEMFIVPMDNECGCK